MSSAAATAPASPATSASRPASAIAGHDEVVAAAGGAVDRLAANAAASEAARRLEPDSMAAITASGLGRLLVPRRYGGYEGELRTQAAAMAVLAQGDPAASWVQMVLGGHDWVVGSFPEACQDEVFGPDPDVRIPGTLAAQGKARRVAGGWELSGRWQFCSGVDHGEWLLIGAVADVAPAVGADVPTRAPTAWCTSSCPRPTSRSTTPGSPSASGAPAPRTS